MGTVFKPVFFAFPDDLSLYDNDKQFMVGDDLLGIPVIVEGDSKTNTTLIYAYFPNNSDWFDFHTGDYISKE